MLPKTAHKGPWSVLFCELWVTAEVFDNQLMHLAVSCLNYPASSGSQGMPKLKRTLQIVCSWKKKGKRFLVKLMQNLALALVDTSSWKFPLSWKFLIQGKTSNGIQTQKIELRTKNNGTEWKKNQKEDLVWSKFWIVRMPSIKFAKQPQKWKRNLVWADRSQITASFP